MRQLRVFLTVLAVVSFGTAFMLSAHSFTTTASSSGACAYACSQVGHGSSEWHDCDEGHCKCSH